MDYLLHGATVSAVVMALSEFCDTKFEGTGEKVFVAVGLFLLWPLILIIAFFAVCNEFACMMEGCPSGAAKK